MSDVELQSYKKSEGLQNDGYENKGFAVDTTEQKKQKLGDRDVDPEQVVLEDGMKEYKEDDAEPGTDDDDEDEDEGEYNCCSGFVYTMQKTIYGFWEKCKKFFWILFLLALLILYLVYFAFALKYEFGTEASWRLLVCTVIGGILLALNLLAYAFSDQLNSAWKSFKNRSETKSGKRIFTIIRWILYLAMMIFMVVYLIVEVFIDEPEKLVYIGGLAAFLLLLFIFSTNPARVKWHPVFWGISLQFIFALMILRTDWGRAAFEWLGDRVTEFLSYTIKGAKFVFDPEQVDRFIFAVYVLPIIVYVGSMTAILYYLGVIQILVKYIGMFLSFCLGTSAAESLAAASNIFLGMTEAPLIIKNYVGNMTQSEIHAVMTGGFATIAGSVLGAYIAMGVPATHLLSASVMSAPAALALSKLACPETNPKKVAANQDFSKMAKSKDRNLVEAAANGAMFTIQLVLNIAVNLIAFISILAFLNATLTWFGNRIGVEQLTFELISSYLLYPIAIFMGVDTRDCRKIAELIGVKTFTNEFIAYQRLGKIITNNVIFNEYITTYPSTSSWEWRGMDVYLNPISGVTNAPFNQTVELEYGILHEERSVMIATYALCGFANFGSIGITLGGMQAIAPKRGSVFTKLVVRAMVVGNVACFMTACFAGLLSVEKI